MKKSTKLLSVLLALVMVISVIPISASARAIPASTTTVETLISNNSLANLVEYLIKNINNRKDDITGTVLRAVFLAAGDTFNIPKETDVTALSDEQCATLLLDWLDKNIPQWASSLTENKYYGLITGAANLLGIDLDLSDVNGALQTLGSAAKAVKGKNSYGILQHLSPDALIKSKTLTSTTYIKRSDGDLFVVKQLIQFINDAIPALKEAVKGNLNLGSLINNFADLSEYESLIKELPKLIKSYLYLLIDGNAAAGNFKAGETSGDWGTSAYKGYNADQLLAAALIRFVNDNDDVVTTAEADKALKLSFYEILSTYAPVLYKNFAVDFLNDNIQGLIDKLSNVNAEIRGQFKETIPTFDENTFADIFNNASSNGFLGQLNNILVKIAELVLAPEAYKAMDLVSGDNSNLNSNLTKFCRYTLPLLFEIEDQLGFSFPDTVKKNYKTLSLSEMAVYILKPFYTTWFKNSSAAAVDSADTLADLAALAVYYTATNSDWLNIDYNFDSIKSEIFAKDGKMN
ncbi:MAG: hypothetical protein J1E34_09770, partial [Oscillospiraceae bacterium]|nr:hypothetical protein [Oscillospiraceae bacterium]